MATPDLPRKELLYAEASSQIQAWVLPTLQRLGCAVTCALDINAARQPVDNNQPLDLVLLGDLTRPNELTTGVPLAELTLIKSLRENRLYRKIPIIIFTSLDWLPQAYEAGASAHLVKPAGAEELEHVLAPYLLITAPPITKLPKRAPTKN